MRYPTLLQCGQGVVFSVAQAASNSSWELQIRLHTIRYHHLRANQKRAIVRSLPTEESACNSSKKGAG